MTANILNTLLPAGTLNRKSFAVGTPCVATGNVGQRTSMSLVPFPARDLRPTTDAMCLSAASYRLGQPAGRSGRQQERGPSHQLPRSWRPRLGCAGVGK
ncbi:MAG: hypothetical protein K1X57_20245 [Gemmataceae bacterium]|nr:hypothetical protein [Gemmataceae bacterium]